MTPYRSSLLTATSLFVLMAAHAEAQSVSGANLPVAVPTVTIGNLDAAGAVLGLAQSRFSLFADYQTRLSESSVNHRLFGGLRYSW